MSMTVCKHFICKEWMDLCDGTPGFQYIRIALCGAQAAPLNKCQKLYLDNHLLMQWFIS